MLAKRICSGAARVAAVLALGAEAVLRGGVSAAGHDVEAVRVVRPEVRDEAAAAQSLVRTCWNVMLSGQVAPVDDVERLAAAVREARCTHHVEGDQGSLNQLPASDELHQ